MSDQQVRAVKSLEVDDVKIYEARGEKLSILAKGKLEILYIPELDRFILRLNNFKYILSLHLPIMASLSGEGSYRSYVLPNVGGHYIVKLKSAPAAAIFRNMETVFSSYSQFSYQQNHEHDLENQAHRRGDYPVAIDQEGVSLDNKALNQSDAVAKAGNYIKIGGEILRQNFIKATSYIGKMSQPKDASLQAQGPNQLAVRSIEELKDLENGQSVDLPRYEVVALTILGKEIEKLALSHAEQDIGVKLHPTSDNRLLMLKKTALESAHSLWKGMDEALDVLGKTVKAKRTNTGLPQDKMDVAFKKIDQSLKGEAPLPMHQISPNQQQPEFGQQSQAGHFQKSQDKANTIRCSDVSKSGGIFRNLGAIKQKIVNIRGQSKENYVA